MIITTFTIRCNDFSSKLFFSFFPQKFTLNFSKQEIESISVLFRAVKGLFLNTWPSVCMDID